MTATMGNGFLDLTRTSLQSSVQRCSNSRPLLLLLGKGSDPSQALQSLAAEMNPKKLFAAVSLGRGQWLKAAKLLEDSKRWDRRAVSLLLSACSRPTESQPLSSRLRVPCTLALCFREGGWVLLQNCHLSRSQMPFLETTVASLAASAASMASSSSASSSSASPVGAPHPDFRLFISAQPSQDLPLPLLAACNKFAVGQPQGLR